MPKARGTTGLSEREIYRSGHSERRERKRLEEEKVKGEQRKKVNAFDKVNSPEQATCDPKKVDEDGCEGIDDTDFSVGVEFEKMIVESACIWDEPVTYELQVELLLTLQRITEHFAAASLSISQSRPLDAVCIVVTGCLAALADAVMRKIAVRDPSDACSHLMGKTKDGRQLGHAGFGISVASFATQSETLEVHTPELAIARTAVLDYFQSPQQRRLEKIFSWEEDYILKPSHSLIKYLRNIAHAVGLPSQSRPHYWLLDDDPISSPLMKNYPELKCYRDIVFWWKYFLNPDAKSFPNRKYVSYITQISRKNQMEYQLKFTWNPDENGYDIATGLYRLRCRPNPKEINPENGKPYPPESLPTHRFMSTATPSFYLPSPVIKTEDDVIYRPNLPNFGGDCGAVLNQRDSELLISYMTVPYLRLPLILTFFASEDRIHKLQSPELRLILDSVLFEPGRYLRMDCCKVEPTIVPTSNVDLLASPYGMLLNELCRSPETVIRSVIILLKGALACDTGSVIDDGAPKFNASTMIILYTARMGARVDNYLSFLVDYNKNKHDSICWPIRDSEITPESLAVLQVGLQSVRSILVDQYAPLLNDYLKRLDLEITEDPTDEELIGRNSRLSCDLHSHKLLLYRNYHVEDYTPSIAKNLLGSFVFLTTRHTWNTCGKPEVEGVQMPEIQIYALLQSSRRRVTTFLQSCPQRVLDDIMQTVVQVSSSLTGSFMANTALFDQNSRWYRIQGARSCGRWAVGSTHTSKRDEPQHSQTSFDTSPVEEIEDNGTLGVEIDIQLGQMTLRSRHLSALTTRVADHSDVKLILGDSTIQASLISTAESCDVYRLIGLNCTIEHWKVSHTECPPLDEHWDREYDPAELGDTENWIVSLFEPIRVNFFSGPLPPPMQFMLPTVPLSETAEVAMILGLHQTLGGPYKLIYLFRRLRCVHIYEVVSHGREWWWCLHLTTDYRYSLSKMEPDGNSRRSQYPDWWLHGSGMPYPVGIAGYLSNNVTSKNASLTQESVLIHRDAHHKDNFSGGRETFVPSRLLAGVIPESLLESYHFWSDESEAPNDSCMESLYQYSRNYKRLCGYPVEENGEYIIIVEFIFSGSWPESAFNAPANRNKANIQCTGLPGRTVSITKRPLAIAKADFEKRVQIASRIESLNLMVTSKLSAKAMKGSFKDVHKGVNKMSRSTFGIDDKVEIDIIEDGKFIPAHIRRVNDDGTYDIEFTDEYKWLGVKQHIGTGY